MKLLDIGSKWAPNIVLLVVKSSTFGTPYGISMSDMEYRINITYQHVDVSMTTACSICERFTETSCTATMLPKGKTAELPTF